MQIRQWIGWTASSTRKPSFSSDHTKTTIRRFESNHLGTFLLKPALWCSKTERKKKLQFDHSFLFIQAMCQIRAHVKKVIARKAAVRERMARICAFMEASRRKYVTTNARTAKSDHFRVRKVVSWLLYRTEKHLKIISSYSRNPPTSSKSSLRNSSLC